MVKRKFKKLRRMRLNIQGLIDNAKCYEMVRHLRWPEGTECPHCHSNLVVKNGRDPKQTNCQHYLCRDCGKAFDDLTKTVPAGHHRPLSDWMLCLYFMGLNLSNAQIAEELEINETQIQEMTTTLRKGIVAQEPQILLEGTVECDEVYVIAGHKGHPESVKKKGGTHAVFLHCLGNGGGWKGREAGERRSRTSRRFSE